MPLAQDLRDKLGDRDQRIHATQQQRPADEGFRAAGQVPRQNNLRVHSRKPRRENGRPVIASMMAMHEVNALFTDELTLY